MLNVKQSKSLSNYPSWLFFVSPDLICDIWYTENNVSRLIDSESRFHWKLDYFNKETVPAIRVAPVGRQPGGQSVMAAVAYCYLSSLLFFMPLFWKHQYRRLILSLIYLNNQWALIKSEIKLFKSLIKHDYMQTYRN